MSHEPAAAQLLRALSLSQEIVSAAERLNLQAVKSLDVERMQLIKSYRMGRRPVRVADRALLDEIAVLNDRAIGLVEHHRRKKGREMDMAAVGRRAVAAYSTIRLQR